MESLVRRGHVLARAFHDSVQGMKLKTEEEMHRDAKLPWNPRGKPELTTWLLARQGQHDVARLKSLGNIVIPAQARVALHLLAHLDAS